jgi:xanthine dehydrogenase accessory factor
MVTDVLAAASALVAEGRRGVMATCVSGPSVGLTALFDTDGSLLAGEGPAIPDRITDVDHSGVPKMISHGDSSWFVEPVVPAPRLLVLGAISVADALVPMAAAAGFAVTVIDPREWLARTDRYPEATTVRCGEPSGELRQAGIDSATAVVSFLHEPRLEDEVLQISLASSAPYVGSMGSSRTTAAKRQRLAEAGLSPTEVDRLHAPIGLDIGAQTPKEIAVAILAEIVAATRGAA